MVLQCEFAERGMEEGFQQDLLELWEKANQKGPLPDFRSFPFDHFSASLDHIMCCDVRYSSATPDFVIQFHGEGFTRTYGRRCHGRWLKDVLPDTIRARTLNDYVKVALTKRPLFSSNLVNGADGVTVRYNRLLLPFTIWNNNTDRIVCAIQLKSDANTAIPYGLLSPAAEL